MNRDEKIYYVYVKNGKAVITEEKPDFDKVHDYMIMKADGIELFMGVHKNQEDVLLPDEPIDVASMLINATITVEPDNFGPLSPLRNKGSQTFAKYDTNQLQEIADHLLTYCKAQERGFKDACCENYKSESV